LKKRLRRMVGMTICPVCLVIVMSLLLSAFGVSAAWDGYSESEKVDDGTYCLMDANNVGILLEAGGIPSTEVCREGMLYSLSWSHATTTRIRIDSVPRDWREYDELEVWIYNETPTNGQIMFVVNTDAQTTEGESYFNSNKFAADWTGWRKFNMSLPELSVSRSAVWDKVNHLRIECTGWGMVANANTQMYLDSIYLKKSGTDSTSSFSEEFRIKFENANKGAVAVYDQSANALSNGSLVPLLKSDSSAIAYEKNGELFVPAEFFSEHFGCKVTKDAEFSITKDDGASVTLSKQTKGHKITSGDHTVYVAAKSSEYLADGEVKLFASAPELTGKEMYVPLSQTAKALGKYAVTKGKLCVVSESEDVYAIGNSRQMSDLISYMVSYVPVDVSSITQADFNQLRANWKRYLIGSENQDLTNSYIKARVDSINKEAKKLWETLNLKDADELFTLWGDATCTSTTQMADMYINVETMARAWALKGTELYHNEKLAQDIISCLDWLYENVYGENITAAKKDGFLGGGGFNWYDWEINVPQYMTNTLMLIEEVVPRQQLELYLEPVNVKIPSVKNTGSNRIYVAQCVIQTGILENDAQKIIDACAALAPAISYVSEGEGFYDDGTYIFHTRHMMNGAYGISNLEALTPILSTVGGTKFAITDPRMNNVATWIYEVYEPFIYQNGMMGMTMGRGATWEHEPAINLLKFMVSVADSLEADDAARVKSLIKHNATAEKTQNIWSWLSFNEINKLQEIMDDDSILPRDTYEINKMYYNGDRMVHQRNNFAFGLAMSSSRIYNYESINNQNMTGWYTGDGMTYLYNDNQFHYDGYKRQSFWSGDPYHMPGVTADTQERKAVSIRQGNEYLSSKDFVGGVSDGLYGAAAMDLESYHGPGSENTTSDSYGGPAPAHNCSLEAKKSWFMFDDEIVCLGADITANDGFDVQTTIEQRYLMEKAEDTSGIKTETYDVANVIVSDTPQEENKAENTVDNNLDTRWSAEGEAYAVFDLGAVRNVGYVGIAFMSSETRRSNFEILISSDNENWEEVFKGQSVAGERGIQPYNVGGKNARYIKIMCHGNTENKWNSILEFKAFAPTSDGVMVVDQNAGYIVGTEDIAVDGEMMPKLNEYDRQFENPSWIYLEDVAGYWLPSGGKVTMKKTNSTTNYVTFWLEHGKNPSGEKYEYVILPRKTAEQTQSYAQSPDVSILSNTPSLQAVKENKLGILQCVFRSAGSCEGITVENPCIVMKKEENGITKISVSDPTHKLNGMVIKLDGAYNIVDADDSVSVKTEDNSTVISINCTDSCGKTYNVQLSK